MKQKLTLTALALAVLMVAAPAVADIPLPDDQPEAARTLISAPQRPETAPVAPEPTRPAKQAETALTGRETGDAGPGAVPVRFVWDNQPARKVVPPGTAAFTRALVDDHLIVGVSVHEHDRVLSYDRFNQEWDGADGRYYIHPHRHLPDWGFYGDSIRPGPPGYPGGSAPTLETEGHGTIRIPCHLFHGNYLTIIIGGPHPQTTTETIDCAPPGGEFVPNQPLPVPVLLTEGKPAVGKATSGRGRYDRLRCGMGG